MDTSTWVYADWILLDGKGFDPLQCIMEPLIKSNYFKLAKTAA